MFKMSEIDNYMIGLDVLEDKGWMTIVMPYLQSSLVANREDECYEELKKVAPKISKTEKITLDDNDTIRNDVILGVELELAINHTLWRLDDEMYKAEAQGGELGKHFYEKARHQYDKLQKWYYEIHDMNLNNCYNKDYMRFHHLMTD